MIKKVIYYFKGRVKGCLETLTGQGYLYIEDIFKILTNTKRQNNLLVFHFDIIIRDLFLIESYCFFVVSEKIGKFARPDFLQEAPGLPKTRSGKIMRRVLRKIARNDHDLGDVSTMADESVIEVLYKHRPNHVDFPM